MCARQLDLVVRVVALENSTRNETCVEVEMPCGNESAQSFRVRRFHDTPVNKNMHLCCLRGMITCIFVCSSSSLTFPHPRFSFGGSASVIRSHHPTTPPHVCRAFPFFSLGHLSQAYAPFLSFKRARHRVHRCQERRPSCTSISFCVNFLAQNENRKFVEDVNSFHPSPRSKRGDGKVFFERLEV